MCLACTSHGVTRPLFCTPSKPDLTMEAVSNIQDIFKKSFFFQPRYIVHREAVAEPCVLYISTRQVSQYTQLLQSCCCCESLGPRGYEPFLNTYYIPRELRTPRRVNHLPPRACSVPYCSLYNLRRYRKRGGGNDLLLLPFSPSTWLSGDIKILDKAAMKRRQVSDLDGTFQ